MPIPPYMPMQSSTSKKSASLERKIKKKKEKEGCKQQWHKLLRNNLGDQEYLSSTTKVHSIHFVFKHVFLKERFYLYTRSIFYSLHTRNGANIIFHILGPDLLGSGLLLNGWMNSHFGPSVIQCEAPLHAYQDLVNSTRKWLSEDTNELYRYWVKSPWSPLDFVGFTKRFYSILSKISWWNPRWILRKISLGFK